MRPIRSNLISSAIGARTSRRTALKRLGGGAAAFVALGGASHPGGVAALGAAQDGAPSAHAYRLAASEPVRYDAGLARIVTQAEFPVLKAMSLRLEELDPGGLQSPHWHLNAGEVHYVVAGEGMATVVSPGGEHAEFALRPGSVSFFPLGHHHAIHNTGAETMKIIAAHSHEAPTELTAGEVFPIAPRPIMAQILGVAEADFPEVPEASPRKMVLLETATPPEEPAADPSATVPEPYTLNLDGLDPAVYEGGTVTNVRGKELARLDGISFLPLFIEVGECA